MSNFKERICIACGGEFNPKSGSQKYCEECRKTVQLDRMRNFRKAEAERNKSEKCCICGGKFGEMIRGQPYCHMHRARYRKYGEFELPKRKPASSISFSEDCLKIVTKNGEVVLADVEDYDLLNDKSWSVSSHGYATTTVEEKVVYMHRLILDNHIKDNMEVDHINGNRLDNRKSNLRVCEHRDNLRNLGLKKNNKSGYPGVRRMQNGKYRAVITVNYKQICIGTFPNFDAAVNARKLAEIEYFGEYARKIEPENTL